MKALEHYSVYVEDGCTALIPAGAFIGFAAVLIYHTVPFCFTRMDLWTSSYVEFLLVSGG